MNIKPGALNSLVMPIMLWMFSFWGTPVVSGYSVENEGLLKEDWYIQKINGMKAGYARIYVERKGDRIITKNEQFLRMGRLGSGLEIRVDNEYEETLEGKGISFRKEQWMGAEPTLSEGRFEGGKLVLQRSQYGKTSEKEIAWNPEVLLPYGAFLKLKEIGMEEGMSFKLNLFQPDVYEEGGVEVEYEIVGKEQINETDQAELWKVVQTMILPSGVRIPMDIWIDDGGELVQAIMKMGVLTVEMAQASAEEALTDFVGPEVFEETLIKVNGIQGIEEKARVTYRVSLKSNEDVELEEILIPETSEQRVKIIAPGIYDVEVMSIANQAEAFLHEQETRGEGEEKKPLEVENSESVIAGPCTLFVPPADFNQYQESSFYINYQDSGVAELVEELEPLRELAPAQRARRLTRWVYDFVHKKNYDIGFATAAEVARTREGDCTEHAVLLAALGRALDLPSQVGAGLVLLPLDDETGVMGFHLWTRFFIDGRWVDYDATLSPDSTPSTRILLTQTSLRSEALFDLSLGISKLIGNLDVEIHGLP